MHNMKMIVGLGNPGKEYERTRHNAGFLVIDELCNKLNITLDQKKMNALFTIYRHNGDSIIIMKPQTYMNLSGEAVMAFSNYYNIDPSDIIVVHDDLDLPLGKIRIREKGSCGGQNGMRNIINLLHTSDIKRIRIGISHDRRFDTKDYVLGKISNEDTKIFDEVKKKAVDALIYSFDNSFINVMNRFN